MFLSGHFYQILDTTSYPGRHGRMGDKLQKKGWPAKADHPKSVFHISGNRMPSKNESYSRLLKYAVLME